MPNRNMPNLAAQIETLYRVIGQLPGQSVSGDPRLPRSEAHSFSSPQSGRSIPARWLCSFYCLWFSLPLSVWLSSGWFGLLLYWQALSGVACLVEKFTRKPSFAFRATDPRAIDLRNGAAACAAIELEAQ
jgi:hypothetical protein